MLNKFRSSRSTRLALITLLPLLFFLAGTVFGQEMTRPNVNVMQQASSVILNRHNCDCQTVIRGESTIRDIVPIVRQNEPPEELSLGEIARRIRAERRQREQTILSWPTGN